ncbi:endonuclease/exonuclease/phosphatase family protein [Allobranchiibius sp. CTAmp26]|uniref:endonuclease/exonuclease/phosphatase family protein n=1 Tax=Allobranchiibius sp. CTAmp26 TaxID=2815214 RepID=UPI001FB7C5C7|nr:endonuclease/exonuclease/phosphatase family protein [Allobranchiibius sp. CTAmp26]
MPRISTRTRTLSAFGTVTLCATAGLAVWQPAAHAASGTTIAQIQGAAHVSPLKGQTVQGVAGRVTATSRTGFWMQSTTPDSDPATSEGIFVYTKTVPTVSAGDDVTVAGTVVEFRPGGSGGGGNLSTTELSGVTVTVVSTGNPLPAPVVIGRDRIAPQQTVEQGNPGNVETAGTPFDPSRNALDFDESLEGMRVAELNAKAVGPTAVSYGETPIVPGQNVRAISTPRGGVLYSGYDHPNAMRLILDTALLPKASVPSAANVGDRYTGLTTGVMDYTFGNFHLMATSVGDRRSAGLTREVTARPSRSQLAVATFNVENLAPQDPATKFSRLAGQIVTNLRAPDLVALEEIQDNSGATDDGTTDSSATVAKLVAAISAAGGPSYQSRWINPQDKTDGGQPGGNIRQVFLFRTDRGLSFVDKSGGTATSSTSVTGKGATTSISASPGRIDPGNAAWTDSRKPLVGEFRWHGAPVFVIANHFNSKGGDDPLMGRWQQPVRSSENQRHQQATVVRGFVDSLLSANKKANVVVLGDLNDFEFSATADILAGHGGTRLTDLPRTLPKNQRYTYDFEGNSQVLDHILLSPELTRGSSYSYDIVHTNAEFSDQDSDHDPQIVRLHVGG